MEKKEAERAEQAELTDELEKNSGLLRKDESDAGESPETNSELVRNVQKERNDEPESRSRTKSAEKTDKTLYRFKGSLAAKIPAWILLVISEILLIGSIAGAALMAEGNIYQSSGQELQQKAFEQVSIRYSIIALAYMGTNHNENYFSGKNFQYGIVQADSLTGLELSDTSIYLENNFKGQVNPDQCFIYSADIGDYTEFYCSDVLWDQNYYIWEHGRQNSYYDEILDYVYDTEQGIFYYKTATGYFPIPNLMLRLELSSADGEETMQAVAKLRYEKEEQVYRLDDMYPVPEWTGSEEIELVKAYNEAAEILGGEAGSVDFSRLMITTFAYTLQIDGDDEIITFPEITRVVLTEEERRLLQDILEYQEVGGKMLHITAAAEATAKRYFVVSYVDAEALQYTGSVWNGDLYVQTDCIVKLIYELRYLIYGIILLSFLLTVLLIIFLCSGAGHRKGKEEIVLRLADRIPFDLFIVIAAAAGAILTCLPMELFYGSISIFHIFLLAVVGIALLLLGNEMIFSFAARMKAGKWWKNTVIYRCLAWFLKQLRRMKQFLRRITGWLGRKHRRVMENLPLYAKAMLAAGALAIAEFCVILGTEYALGAELALWAFEKVVLYLLLCACLIQMKKLLAAGRHIAQGEADYKVDTSRMYSDFRKHGEDLNRIGEGISKAVDERMRSERFKTELITNVSHDIKTPLTSIINYVDLLGKEDINNPAAAQYLEVLERQSLRLKKLIEDLMEASKASTGNLAVNMEHCEAGVFLMQTLGEFEEKVGRAQLELITKKPEEPIYMMADGRHLWRVIDNLMSNICKYAQPGTRVYIDMAATGTEVCFIFRNTSKYPLNITSEELMERFVRGDSSRNTEGNGLGLNIAKSLTELMGGELNLVVDGDLFKVILSFKREQKPMPQS